MAEIGTVFIKVEPDLSPMADALRVIAQGWLDLAGVALDIADELEEKTSGR